jgi:Post-segregation antitoxin CcdA
MHDSVVPSQAVSDKVEISIHIDTELLEQLKHLTNDPSKVVEVAIRQWLRTETSRDEETTRSFPRNPPVPFKGEWND